MPILMIYQEPVALNRKIHQNLRLKKAENLDFAKDINSVPVAGIEFFEASRELPILFSKDDKGEYVPLALLSLRVKGHNLGDNWGDVYMPAFVRRYPFALTNDGTVIFDAGAPHLQEDAGDPLFQEDGKNTEVLDNIIGFLHHMDRHYKMTQEYCRACAEHEFFMPFNKQVMIEQNKAMRMDSLFVIDDKKLSELPDEEITDWFRKGWLAWSYAHLHSLGALGRLVRRERRAGSTQTTDEMAQA